MTTVTLTLTRTTKGTYFYATTDPEQPVTNLYIKKSAFEGEPPEQVVVQIRPVE